MRNQSKIASNAKTVTVMEGGVCEDCDERFTFNFEECPHCGGNVKEVKNG